MTCYSILTDWFQGHTSERGQMFTFALFLVARALTSTCLLVMLFDVLLFDADISNNVVLVLSISAAAQVLYVLISLSHAKRILTILSIQKEHSCDVYDTWSVSRAEEGVTTKKGIHETRNNWVILTESYVQTLYKILQIISFTMFVGVLGYMSTGTILYACIWTGLQIFAPILFYFIVAGTALCR